MRLFGRKHKDPVPPEDVRLIHPDGTEIPLECCYGGIDAVGIHQWVAVYPVGVVFSPGMTMRIAMLPAKTNVTVDVQP